MWMHCTRQKGNIPDWAKGNAVGRAVHGRLRGQRCSQCEASRSSGTPRIIPWLRCAPCLHPLACTTGPYLPKSVLITCPNISPKRYKDLELVRISSRSVTQTWKSPASRSKKSLKVSVFTLTFTSLTNQNRGTPGPRKKKRKGKILRRPHKTHRPDSKSRILLSK